MDNPETVATLGTQDIGLRHRQYKNTAQKTKKINNTDPTINGG